MKDITKSGSRLAAAICGASIVFMLALMNSANAATIMNLTKPCGLFILGDIEPGDDLSFHDAVITSIRFSGITHCGSFTHVYVYSRGGDVRTAMKIGKQIRELKVATEGPDTRTIIGNRTERAAKCQLGIAKVAYDFSTNQGDSRCICASACFMIWAAGVQREGDAILIHRPYFDPTEYKNLSAPQAEVAYQELVDESQHYLVAMGVSSSIITHMFSVDSGHAEFLTDDELKSMAMLPYFAELLNAKCGPTSTAQDEAYIHQCYKDIAANKRVVGNCEPPGYQQRSDDSAKCRGTAWSKIIDDAAVQYVHDYGK